MRKSWSTSLVLLFQLTKLFQDYFEASASQTTETITIHLKLFVMREQNRMAQFVVKNCRGWSLGELGIVKFCNNSEL